MHMPPVAMRFIVNKDLSHFLVLNFPQLERVSKCFRTLCFASRFPPTNYTYGRSFKGKSIAS